MHQLPRACLEKAKMALARFSKQSLRSLRRDLSGATALEYGLILCLIVVVMVVGMTALGHETVAQWNFVSNQVSSGIAQANS